MQLVAWLLDLKVVVWGREEVIKLFCMDLYMAYVAISNQLGLAQTDTEVRT
jgi:hypothetical protein